MASRQAWTLPEVSVRFPNGALGMTMLPFVHSLVRNVMQLEETLLPDSEQFDRAPVLAVPHSACATAVQKWATSG
jgi:hypothetical protein